MNNDIVPSLLEEIQKQFDEEIKANEKIKSILILPLYHMQKIVQVNLKNYNKLLQIAKNMIEY